MAAPDKVFSGGKYAAALNAGGAPWQTVASSNVVWPYNANVVWQDTTSNATYCNASVALQSSKGVS